MKKPICKETAKVSLYDTHRLHGPLRGPGVEATPAGSESRTHFIRYKANEPTPFVRPSYALRPVRALPYVSIVVFLLGIDYYTFNYLQDVEARTSRHELLITDIRTDLDDQRSTIDRLSKHIDGLDNVAVSLQRRFQIDRRGSGELAGRISNLEEHMRTLVSTVDTSRIGNKTTPSDPETALDYQIDSTVPLFSNAVVHRTSGQADYWLVKRSTNPVASRVIPYGTTDSGVLIHCLDDGRDYLLLSNGEWKFF